MAPPTDIDVLAGLAPRDPQMVVCDHAEQCGGCPIIGLPYGEQLALKRGRVVQSAARYAGLELVYTEPVCPADPVVGYRTRAKLIVAPGGRLGLFAKGGGHMVVDIPRCQVLSPPLARVAASLREHVRRDEASRGPLAPFEANGHGVLRAVDLREVRDDGGARVLLTLVVHRARADRAALTLAAQRLATDNEEILGVALNYHDGDSPQILGSETVVVYGETTAPDRVGHSTHLATYGSFVQAHRGQTERVHSMLADILGLERVASASESELRRAYPAGKARVLDLYGGSGAISLALASCGASMHLIESFEPAARQAAHAAERQALDVKADAADAATALKRLIAAGAEFDAAVVNPPRRGMSSTARELVARLGMPTVVYVSCDPDTLARDIDHFGRLGYGVTTLRPLDMIPLTDEVETVAVLRKVGVPTPRVIYEDDEILVVEKGPHEPTTPQGEYESSLLHRARKLPQAKDAVPVHRIDIGTSGLVMLSKKAEYVSRWQGTLTAATTRKIYLAGARGVTPTKGAITRDLREGGKALAARTRYRRLAVASGHSVLRVIPEQGRTHQIRRHLAAIGHPILGDERYGHPATNRFFEEKNALDRTFLHCVRIEFDHPKTGQRLIVEAPLPGDLRAVLERTSGPGTLRFLDHKQALGHSGVSSLPPAPDSRHDRGSALDIDSSTQSIRIENVADEDDLGG
ncbi:MAG: pseudouridine synthase [Polyangiaceae bacterium]